MIEFGIGLVAMLLIAFGIGVLVDVYRIIRHGYESYNNYWCLFSGIVVISLVIIVKVAVWMGGIILPLLYGYKG